MALDDRLIVEEQSDGAAVASWMDGWMDEGKGRPADECNSLEDSDRQERDSAYGESRPRENADETARNPDTLPM